MKPSLTVLMTGAGAPGAPGIIKCLLQEPRINLLLADADRNAIGRHLHQPFFTIPAAGDDRFASALLSLCREHAVQALVPLVTRELLPLALNKQLFKAQQTAVLVSSAEAITLANDKARCYQFLQEQDIAVPPFFVATSVAEFIAAAGALGYPHNPFCFKPTAGNGSRGFRIVDDTVNEADQLFTQKPNNTYITYAHAVNILSAQPFPPLLVSAFLPGEEYSVDCLAQHGNAVLVVPRTRLKMVNGISVQGRFVFDKEIIDYCSRIIKAVGLHGNIGIQLRRSTEGQPLLLEINPRVQGTIVSALGAGVNLPLLALKQELGLPISTSETTVAWGVSFARHWTEVYYREPE